MDQHTAHDTQLQVYRDADAVAHTFKVQQSLSAGELSPEVLVDLGPLLFDSDRSPVDVEVAMPSAHAMALSTLCGDGGTAATRQMWHYNDLDVLSWPDYLGSECEAKLAFALLHGTDPRLVTLDALHRAGITIYRQLFAILSSLFDKPAALYSRLGLGFPSDVDFGATAEDSGLIEVNGTADLFSHPGLDVPSDINFGAIAGDSELTEVPADPDLRCDDRPLTYRRGDDEPDADGRERHRSLLPGSNASGVVQSFVCTTLPTKTQRKPTADAKRGELSIKEACSPEYLPLFLKGIGRELGEMDR